MTRSGLDVPGPAREAWTALTDGLAEHVPACRGDARFTSDGPGARDVEAMRTVCGGCPLLAACEAYADAAPGWSMAGFWAGATRGHNTRADYRRREAAA